MNARSDILPDSRCATPRRTRIFGGVLHEATYCLNCGKAGPWVPTENMEGVHYICPACAEAPHVQQAFSTAMLPDDLFWLLVKSQQIESFGHELTAAEMAMALANDGTTTPMKLLKREYDRRHSESSTRF